MMKPLEIIAQSLVREINTIRPISSESLENTPDRVAKFWESWLKPDLFKFTCFKTEGYNELIVLDPIIFYSMCEHHLLPFFGQAYVAYLPDAKICGLSKIPRLVTSLARRPTTQEYLTETIANELESKLKPRFLIVVLKAQHLCMMMRGAMQPEASAKTSAIRGDKALKDEALRLMGF